MSRITHWVLFFLAVAFSALAATMLLLFEVETGLPYRFVPTLIVSALLAVVLPVLFVLLGKRLGVLKRVVPAYLVYYLVCVISFGVLSRFVFPN